jgi:hypothetical protein
MDKRVRWRRESVGRATATALMLHSMREQPDGADTQTTHVDTASSEPKVRDGCVKLDLKRFVQ